MTNAALQMQLRSVIGELNHGIEEVRAELQRQIDRGDCLTGTSVWQLRDVAGRFLLLDAVAARATCVAALAQLRSP